MKSVYLFSLTAFFLATMVFSVHSETSGATPQEEIAYHQDYDEMAQTEEGKYVEITTHFPNVYKELDPKSEIITQPKRGDFLELISEGKRWYRVRVGDQVGFLETRAGVVVDQQRSPLVPVIISIFAVLVLASFVTVGAVFFHRKHKAA